MGYFICNQLILLYNQSEVLRRKSKEKENRRFQISLTYLLFYFFDVLISTLNR